MVDVDHLHLQEAEALPEVLEEEEEEVEEPGDLPHMEGTWMTVAIPWILTWVLPEDPFQWKEDHHHEVGVLLLKGRPLQDQFAAAVEWGEEPLCHAEEIVMEARLEGNPCPLVEMFICPQEMMDIPLKTAIQAEITPVLVIQEIMLHHQESILTVIMVIPVHVMTTHQEAIVIEMDMVGIVTIQIIRVEVPTEIHMRVMVTHVVLHLHEGPRHLMVEAVAMMITAAHGTDMVEVETVTQAAEVISTQVVVIGLADKNEGFPLLWKGGTLLHVIPTAVQAAEHQEVVAVEEADLIEGEAEADTRNKQNFGPKSPFKETNKKWKLFCHNYPRTTKRKNCVTFFKFPVKFPFIIFMFLWGKKVKAV